MAELDLNKTSSRNRRIAGKEATKPLGPAEDALTLGEALYDIGEGAVTSGLMGAADTVDMGAALPPPKPGTEFMFPKYAAIESLFEQLSGMGISRENAEKLVKEKTGGRIDLEGNQSELIGEVIGLPLGGAATKLGSLVKVASKYGDKAGDYLSEIGDELGDMFSRSTPGGDDFDGMAPATVADTPPVAAQTDQAFDVTPTMPDTSVSPTMIGTNTGAGRQAVDEYDAMKAVDPDMDEAELFAQTGVYMGADGKPRFELDTTDARLSTVSSVDDELVPIVQTLSAGDTVNLEELLDFRSLFDAYDKKFYDSTKLDFVSPTPLTGVKVEFVKDLDARGSYSYTTGNIKVNAELLDDPDQLLSTLMHEVQHAVQHREGFTSGSAKEYFIEASAKAIDPDGRMGRITSMSDVIYLNSMAQAGIKDANQFAIMEMQKHVGVTPNLSDEAIQNYGGFFELSEVLFNAMKREGFGYDDVIKGDINSAYNSQNIRRFIDELAEHNVSSGINLAPGEVASEISSIKSLLDSLDAAGNTDTLLVNILQPQMKIKFARQHLEDVENLANANYHLKYGEIESRLVQDRHARRQELLDMGFTRGDIFAIMRDEFPPMNYAVNKDVMQKGGFDVSDLEVTNVYRVKGKPEYEGVFVDEDLIRLEGSEKGIPQGLLNASKESSDEGVENSGILDFGKAKEKKELQGTLTTMRKGIAQRMADSQEAYEILAKRGDTDKLVPGQKILSLGNRKGERKPLTVEGYSVSTSPKNIEQTIALYKDHHKPFIEKGIIAPEPQIIQHKGQNYRLMIHLKDADGNVERHYADMVTHNPTLFSSPKVVEDTIQGANEIGFSRAVFHSTGDAKNMRVPKMVPETLGADIGFHVGTTGSANDRIMLQSMARQASQTELDQAFAGKSVMPLRLSDDLKPARIIDLNAFKSPQNWLEELTDPFTSNTELGFFNIPIGTEMPSITLYPNSKFERTVYMSPQAFAEGVNEDVWRSAVLTAEKFLGRNVDTTKNIDDRKEWFEAVKKIATDNGYDSFVYKNMKEGKGDDSYMLLDPRQVKSFTAKDFDPNNPDITMAKGGVVPMDKQMDMFADGGLEQDGGTNDPVSGNEVPPGSTQEEVRDDIPAQLSEGEFVFPADVVRFIGLEKLMQMRQEAKMGLKMMEEMGQMGNSDEATMPDDLPFDINDLDMDDGPEYNVGGFVPAVPQQQQFGISGYTPAAAPTTGFTQAASQQFVQPTTPVAQAPTPTMQQYEVPQFSDFVGGGFGEYDELREYRNEAGQVMMIPFKDGSPISPIPEGYTFYDPEETATEEVTTTPTTPQTTQVREESDGDDPGPKYSTTDVSGIGYDRSKLEPELREVISEFGFGIGALGETFNMYSNIASALSKDPRVKDSSLTSAALGGVLDSYRGGNVTFSDPNKMGRKTGQYDINTPLHEMTPGMQLDIAAVARSVVKDMRDIFVDKDGKPKTVSEVDRSLKTAAAGLGVDVTIPGTNITKSRTTVIREIAEARADRDRERIEKERREAQIQQIIEDTGDTGETTGTGGAAAETFTTKGEQSIQDLLASIPSGGSSGSSYSDGREGYEGNQYDLSSTDSAFGGDMDNYGFDDDDDDLYNQGGLAAKKKPKSKKMKRGGLASKK